MRWHGATADGTVTVVGTEDGEESAGATTAIHMLVTAATGPFALQRRGDGNGVVCGSAVENGVSKLNRALAAASGLSAKCQ